MRAKVRKLVIGVALVVAFTLLVLQPFLLNAQTTTTLPSSSGTGVVESKGWLIKPKLANGAVTINAPPEVIVTIKNTQANATPAPFDQFINISLQQVENALGTNIGSYLWSQAESHDFLNVIFVNTSSGKPLYAWVQNFTPNWVAVWVKLPNGVPAHGAVNITLEFTNASQYPYTGLATSTQPFTRATITATTRSHNMGTSMTRCPAGGRQAFTLVASARHLRHLGLNC